MGDSNGSQKEKKKKEKGEIKSIEIKGKKEEKERKMSEKLLASTSHPSTFALGRVTSFLESLTRKNKKE